MKLAKEPEVYFAETLGDSGHNGPSNDKIPETSNLSYPEPDQRMQSCTSLRNRTRIAK